MRRLQVPAHIAEAAARAQTTDPLTQDIARGLPVSAVTLAAIMASGIGGTIEKWAETVLDRMTQAENSRIADVLVSSGFDDTGCTPAAIGILDPEYDGERIVAVVRASAGPEEYERITSGGWQQCQAPEGMPYLDLRGDTLAEALETIAAGASLLLHSVQPNAWLSTKIEPRVITAATALATPVASGDDGIYAVVDPLNTTAVLSLFQVLPGPKISVRTSGAWIPDDGTLQGQLTGLNPPPVVAVSPAQVPDVLRQVDDFATTHPATDTGPNGGQAPSAQAPSAQAPPQPGAAPATPATPSPAQAITSGALFKNAVQLGFTPAHAIALEVAHLNLPEHVTASVEITSPKVAGLCVHAADTGRVFMLQRGMDPKDPAQGKIEFPGGHIEPGDASTLDAAKREWTEETGQKLPPGKPGGTWDSPNGVYRGHVHEIPEESAINLADRKAGTNPDDPHGDSFEAAMWMDPTHLANNPAVRDEVQHTMHLVHMAIDNNGPVIPSDAEEPLTAASTSLSIHHARRIREAKTADSEWDADRAATDIAEQEKRRGFETQISSRYATLKGEGMDGSTASSTVRREIEAENDRRELWEQQRSDALLAEKERRLRMHPHVRLSQELVQRVADAKGEPMHPGPPALTPSDPQALAADAVPRTMLPPQLFKYWVAGKGAIKIKWGIKGDWQRCRDHLTKYVKSDYQTKALCAELHKFATGRWTGSKANKEIEGGGL